MLNSCKFNKSLTHKAVFFSVNVNDFPVDSHENVKVGCLFIFLFLFFSFGTQKEFNLFPFGPLASALFFVYSEVISINIIFKIMRMCC